MIDSLSKGVPPGSAQPGCAKVVVHFRSKVGSVFCSKKKQDFGIVLGAVRAPFYAISGHFLPPKSCNKTLQFRGRFRCRFSLPPGALQGQKL